MKERKKAEERRKKWNKMHTNRNNETFKWQTFLPAATITSCVCVCVCGRASFQRCNPIACEIYNFVRYNVHNNNNDNDSNGNVKQQNKEEE